MQVTGLDHLVLTVADVDASCAFYEQVLGMRVVTFGGGRKALAFGAQRINLHRKGGELLPHALRPTEGSGDLCFLCTEPPQELLQHLARQGVSVEVGPVTRQGAAGALASIYIRDPDGNLLELAWPLES